MMLLNSLPQLCCAAALATGVLVVSSHASSQDDAATVAALDTAFQLAVKNNDADTIARIQADDMILVLGDGRTATKADHVNNAKDAVRLYELQDEVPGTQKVRVWGDTAVVTALLHMKGTMRDGRPFEYKLWFSDTYARTPAGWKYVFGQASLPLPAAPAPAKS